MPTTTDPATWTPPLPGEGGRGLRLKRSSRPDQGKWLKRHLLPAHAHTFLTCVDGDLRTCGVVVGRPGRRATELDGLDLDRLAVAAAGVPEAAARGKLVLVGDDGVAVFQTKLGAHPELAWCGNGTATVAVVLGHRRAAFDLFGPEGKIVRAVQISAGASVRQTWTLSDFTMAEAVWRGRPVVRCDGLNRYAVVLGPLPDDVTPEEARRALAGAELAAKLVILTVSAAGAPHVAFYNANGLHGAAPASGLATLSILARLSSRVGAQISGGVVTFDTKAGPVDAPLPEILVEPRSCISVVMPSLGVMLSPLPDGGWR